MNEPLILKTRPAVKHTRPRGYIENYRPRPKTLSLLADVERVLEEYRDYCGETIPAGELRMVHFGDAWRSSGSSLRACPRCGHRAATADFPVAYEDRRAAS